ncbi:MAG TPA: M13 family metallopeptidase [Pyrinomonadaceae bacterium]|nr:M13 family metallopeptidase [Pyrinomonadaceae bacterium]
MRKSLILCVGLLLVAAALSEFVYSSGRAAVRRPDVHGFDVSNMDTSVSACTNFFQYANGGWVAKNEIPAAYPSWGRFNELADKNQEQLHQILETAARNATARKGSNEQKIGDYYSTCMDETVIETAGLKPLQGELDRISAIKDPTSFQAEVARLQSRGVSVLFRFGSGQDFKQSTQVIGQLFQGGLGLPDRDYYTKEDDKSKEIRDKYVAHVAKTLELAGDDPSLAQSNAQTVMRIETQLARASMNRVERRNPENIYHKTSIAQLKELAPNFNWDAYFREIGMRNAGDINVGQPNFVKELNVQLTAVSLNDWKTYLRWHLLDTSAPALSKKFVEEDFDFSGRTLTGTKEILPRWKRCVTATDRALGEALGQVYVEKHFPPQAKARALAMVQNLIAALRDDLSDLSWMSDATRKRATAKLEAFARKIGYPDKWRDYSGLKVDRSSYLDNLARAQLFDFNRQLGKIAKPVDRTEWGMTPPTVNAYYNPSMNEIVFPAGILQPPFYDPEADDAVNYGGMGAVIGHEMTHGFDDSGAKFDADGNLANWWTDEDLKNFKARAQCVVDEFSAFEVQPGLNQNGNLVVGESIADLGGLTIAYAALKKSMEGKPRPPAIDGFSPEQRFFLGWAQVWAQKLRPEYERLLVNVDPHPVGRFRVIGPLSNMPAFAEAYKCRAGDAMVRPPEKRCQIW